MSSHNREGSRDRELVLSRHQTVPMWDSSDPERAPPPLPLNPGSTSPVTKGNVSPGIQAVAANFTEKLRENSPSPYTTNPMTPKSPEKSLIKGQFHKRMQSLQNTDTRSEFLNYLDSRSPERPLRASFSDQISKHIEKPVAKAESPRDEQSCEQDPPSLLISNRYLSRPLFGESTPPSATMLALQNMQLPPENEPQASTKEPDSSPEPKPAQSNSFGFLSSQILSLTDIASNLQREMTQLSRRSKDNATDLVSLKAATNARDEDIRKSLRDLSSNLASKFLDADTATRWDIGALLGSESGINQTASDSSPNSKKTYSIPRMQSPNSFVAAMEREFAGSPGPMTDGSASIALLEKVLREMATKEGQEKLLELVDELKARPTSDDCSKSVDSTVTKMLEEILNIVKQDPGNKALVRSRTAGPIPDINATSTRSLDPEEDLDPDMDVMQGSHPHAVNRSVTQGESPVTDEMMDIMKRVRSSVIEGGGMTNEVKALVRELRGEVLGMGRNLASQLENVERTRAIEDTPSGPRLDEIAHIIDISLQELRDQLKTVMNNNKQHSSALAEFRAAMDGAEIYSIVKQALDHSSMSQLRDEPDGVRMEKEDILEAVREAWETYKPEIELQNFGLERDEILDCLTEGLKAYQPQHEQAVTYDQVVAAVRAGIPQFEQPPTISKDEIIHTIQECLENSRPRSFDDGQLAAIRDEVLHAVTESMTSQSALTRDSFDSGLGRDEILSAVSDGIEVHMRAVKEHNHPAITIDDVTSIVNDALSSQQSAVTRDIEPSISRDEIFKAIAEGLDSQNSIPREIELNKEDLMEAITAGLNEVNAHANQSLGEQILERIQEELEGLREEVKQQPSAADADTEHALNIINDSIAILRQDVEGYATTASEASGKYEILDTVKEGFRLLQADMEKTITENALANRSGGNPDTPELLDAMEREFEHLRQTLGSLLIRNNSPSEKDEIIDAIRDISEKPRSGNDENISAIIQREFESLRESMTMSIVPAGQKDDRNDRDGIVAAVQATLESFHAQKDQTRDIADNKDDVIAETVQATLEAFHAQKDPAKDIPDNIDDIIAATVQATLEAFHAEKDQTRDIPDNKDDIIAAIHAALEPSNQERSLSKDVVEKDDIIAAIHTAIHAALESSNQERSPPKDGVDKDDIITAVQATLEAFHAQRDQAKDIPDNVDDIIAATVQATLEAFHAEKDQAKDIPDSKDDIIAAIHAALESSNQERSLSKDVVDKDDIIAAIHAALESSNQERSPPTDVVDKDDIITAVQATLEAFHAEKDQTRDLPDNKDDIIAAIHAALEPSNQERSLPKDVIDKDDIITAVQATLEAFYEERGQDKDGADKDEIISAIRDISESHKTSSNDDISKIIHEFESLRNSLTMSLVPAEPKNDKDDIIAAVQVALESFHEEHGQAKDSIGKDEMLGAIREILESHKTSSNEDISKIIHEFGSLRDSLTMSLAPAEPKNNKDDIIAAVQVALESFHENGQPKDGADKDEIISAIRDISESHKASSNEDISKIIQQEFESLRDSLTMSLVPAGLKDDKDDIIAAVQAALESFHEEKAEAQARDGGESAPTTELRDVFHDGVGIIREDLAKLLERPAEFNPSELLHTLREGLGSLKAEVEALRQSQADSEESTSSRGRELILADETSKTSEIEGLKALISQIQVKVDAIEAAPRAQDMPEDMLKKEHMDEVLVGLHELQSSVAGIVARESPVDETTAKKEDTDAIEILLRDTKSQLNEMVFPAPDEIARADQLGSLEEIVKETKDVVTELYSRLESECPTKTDIGTLETLLKDMWIALEESKGKEGEKDGEEGERGLEADAEKLVKSDLQTVEAMIFEVKTQVEELKLPDVETLPTKTEIQDIAAFMNEFKKKVESDQELTGQGFEARKIEHAGLAERIEEAKSVVEGLGEELKSKLDGSHEGLSELKQLLEGLAASAESFTTVENVNELTELIHREFERARGEQDATKLEKEERDASVLVKHDETRAAIIVELGAKIDEKLGEVIAKYDEAQSSMDTKFTEAAERGNEHLEAVTNTKSLAEDIKLVIGSMGDSVSEACERMSADAKAFFEKVDVSYNKMEEMHNEVKTHQAQAQSDVERAAAATERVETKLHEFHPQVLESIQEILSIVGQHYSDAQQTARDLRMDLSTLPTTIPQMLPALPPPEPEKYDDSQVHEKLNNLLERSNGNQVQEALNVLIERVTNDQVHEKLDQLLSKTTSTNGEVYGKLSELLDHATNTKGPIHDKLDTLIGHATNTEQSVNQMMKLDEMHKDIMETSRKMNEMLMAQSALVAEDNQRKHKEAEEAAVALERRTAQREQIEAEILNLKDEKDSMLAMIQRLKTEKDGLTAQNAKLNKEVSGLETALELRHEEMQVMEERADSLEKRILEGVLDHARTVLLSRPNSVHGFTMKKVRSARARNVSASSTASTAKGNPSVLGSSIGLALKKRAPRASQMSSASPAASKERRILSLSHVTGNRGMADRQSGATGGLTNLKRSQSVKSNSSYRKSSWGGRSSVANKENEVFPEVFPEEEENQSGDESDTGTERRTSYTGTYTGSMSYGPGSVISTNRQASTTSTTNETVTTGLQSVVDDEKGEQRTEKDENEESGVEQALVDGTEQQLDEESSKMVLYAPHSDSGLGSEITSTAG